MLQMSVRENIMKHISCGLLFLLAVFVVLPIYAQVAAPPPPANLLDLSNVTLGTILQNLNAQVPNLMRMVTAIAYVMGMFFIVNGLLKLKQYGEARTMMSQEHKLAPAIVYLVVGAMLLYFPTTVRIGMSTFWVEPNPYGYLDETDQWHAFLAVAFGIIQLIGVIAFIRGLVLLSHIGGHSQQGTLSRGLTHIIGGIFCINIYQFVQVILMTIGIQAY